MFVQRGDRGFGHNKINLLLIQLRNSSNARKPFSTRLFTSATAGLTTLSADAFMVYLLNKDGNKVNKFSLRLL